MASIVFIHHWWRNPGKIFARFIQTPDSYPACVARRLAGDFHGLGVNEITHPSSLAPQWPGDCVRKYVESITEESHIKVPMPAGDVHRDATLRLLQRPLEQESRRIHHHDSADVWRHRAMRGNGSGQDAVDDRWCRSRAFGCSLAGDGKPCKE
ncbi:hypothetical protein BD779DRAFT_1471574 [Infundibulicybe gibba]|nr:hypothetical protein BD779DRAFT_1471574 [Infundibulicybe gibba]